MEQNQVVQNFTVLSSQKVDELEAVLYQLEHRKSGARLVWLDRDEENMTFGIAFQTQPWDDTGLFHILEHAVLCGSDKYPVKEPFVELMKSSLNTFLNAMTFADRTFYPVSSRNGQDFINLVRVYMDAVLHPLLHSKPEIFRQEGWHYEFSETGEPSYKGVVFNEMKGAFASPDTLASCELFRRLFPDTCYRFVSGGDPEHIPELTYEQCAAAHKRLYHPSNSYIFLDGRMDIEQILGILDREYLAGFDRAPTPGGVPYQQPVDGGVSEVTYELSSQEDLAGRARLIDGFVAGTFQDRLDMAALQALTDALCGDNQAPLTRRLLEEGLARNLQISMCGDGILQPWIALEARDVDESQFEAVSDALYSEIARLVKDGLDHKRILAALDNLEFQARERDFGSMPQGLVFGMQVLNSWIYGGDPAAFLSVGDLFDQLREKCQAGYFEQLLERVFLKNPHRCRVLMRPSHTVGQERRQQEAARLLAAQARWDPAAIGRLKEEQACVEAWQNTPDSPEALATIPMLRLDQIPAQPRPLPMAYETVSGLPVLRHSLPSGGISYYNLYFAIDDLDSAQLSKTSFLCSLLGLLETEIMPHAELQRELRAQFGALRFAVESYGGLEGPAQCRVFLCASCSALDRKLDRALPLLGEILTETKLNDAKRVKELLCQQRAALSEQIVMNGHLAAITRVHAGAAAEGMVEEYTQGVEYLRWLKNLEEHFDDRFPALAEELCKLSQTIFTRARLTISVTGGCEKAVEAAVRMLSDTLAEGCFTQPEEPGVQPWGPRREGIAAPADISFAAAGGGFPQAASGQARVAGQVVALGYLWNAVRVQGGAYGVGLALRNVGAGEFWSFRDPSAKRTLECYQKSGSFLREAAGMDLTGMIIGAVAKHDPLLTPRAKGKTADSRYWQGITQEDLTRTRQEMLSVTPEDLAKLAADVDRLAKNGSVCVLGSRKQIEACGLDIVEL